jgi:hypothetical protein
MFEANVTDQAQVEIGSSSYFVTRIFLLFEPTALSGRFLKIPVDYISDAVDVLTNNVGWVGGFCNLVA